MGQACAPLTQLHASPLCFFDVFLQGFFFSFYGVCAVISATCRREVVL